MAAEVIAVDGPAGSGKSTIASGLALTLSFHLLVSGALYRIIGEAFRRKSIDVRDSEAITNLVSAIDMQCIPMKGKTRIIYNGTDVTNEISKESYAADASYVGTIPKVREAILNLQRCYRATPGLVAEGRDMGNVVFPEAKLKIFLTASIEVRAERRLRQLNKLGVNANLSDLAQGISQRDEQDAGRAIAPLKLMPDAALVDTSDLTAKETVETLIGMARERGICP